MLIFSIKKQSRSKPLRRTIQRALAGAKETVNEILKDKYATLDEFAKHVTENPEALKIEKNGRKMSLQVEVVESSSKSRHVILFDPELVEGVTTDPAHIDGTFDAVPSMKGANQLLVVLVTRYNVVSIISYENYVGYI